MLPLILRAYWQQILAAVVAAVLALWLSSLWYGPRIDAAHAERDGLRTKLAVQNDAVLALQRDAEQRRAAAQAAIKEQRRRSARLAADNQRLREQLEQRIYKEEQCDDAAAAVREQWLSR